MKNIIINREENIDNEIEDFRLDALDHEKNYTASKIKLTRQPGSDKPLLFYTQELTRNFKESSDPFSHQKVIKVFTPSNLQAVSDTTLEKKYNDTILAHKPSIEIYNPLTDIHSENMNLFLDEKTAEFMEDIGINIEGLSEDFQSLESVSATPFMDDVAKSAVELKKELRDLQVRNQLLKQEMANQFEQKVDPLKLSDEEFDTCLSTESISQGFVQSYLAIKEKIDGLKSKLGEVNNVIFTETRSRIRLPKSLEVSNEIQF